MTVTPNPRTTLRSNQGAPMQFLTIAYGEPAAYDRTAPEIRNAAHDHDAWMESNGKIVAGGMTASYTGSNRSMDGAEAKPNSEYPS